MTHKECGWILLSILMLHGCLVKTPVADITAAENIRQTQDGRIFITGRHGFYELQQQHDDTYVTEVISVQLLRWARPVAGLALLCLRASKRHRLENTEVRRQW